MACPLSHDMGTDWNTEYLLVNAFHHSKHCEPGEVADGINEKLLDAKNAGVRVNLCVPLDVSASKKGESPQ